MPRNSVPYVFLAVLVIILAFILGVHYGKRVEQANRTIKYLLAITPPVTKSPDITYLTTYTLPRCGIQFTYPSTLTVQESSISARFTTNMISELEVSCDKTKLPTFDTQTGATSEAMLKNQKINLATWQKDNTTYLSFSLKHPQARSSSLDTVFVQIDKKLYPLFESTLQLLPPTTQ